MDAKIVKISIDCCICKVSIGLKGKGQNLLYPVCSVACRKQLRLKVGRRVTQPCCICKTPVTRILSWMYVKVCCSPECSKEYRRLNMAALNRELNPTRMDNFETRTKVREGHLKLRKGEGKTYVKFHGRHLHRVVAEEKLLRPLKTGEVVHHKDGDVLNNNPNNLEVLPSQADHARLHMFERLERLERLENLKNGI